MRLKEVGISIERTLNSGEYSSVKFKWWGTFELNLEDNVDLDQTMRDIWETGKRNIQAQAGPYQKMKRAEAEAIILGFPENLRAGLLAELNALSDVSVMEMVVVEGEPNAD